MKKNLTEIVFILDRSGSMSGLEADTVGGFNAMIAKQKREPGEALISTVLFDDESVVIHDRVPVQNIAPMTERDYYVRGARRCSMPSAVRSTTLVTSTSTQEPRMYRSTRSLSSRPTVWKTPAAAMTANGSNR